MPRRLGGLPGRPAPAPGSPRPAGGGGGRGRGPRPWTRRRPGRGGGRPARGGRPRARSALHPQKRLVLPALGLFGLGVILGAAYVLGGHSYWLPVAIHAGGVVFIQVSRPFVEYKGPAWLIGYSSYPICGLLGVTSMALYVAG